MVLILNAMSFHCNAKVIHVVKMVLIHFVVLMTESAAMKVLFTMVPIPMIVSANVMIISQVNNTILYNQLKINRHYRYIKVLNVTIRLLSKISVKASFARMDSVIPAVVSVMMVLSISKIIAKKRAL